MIIVKKLTKFVATDLERFSMYDHGFWTGTEWTTDKSKAIFYNDEETAEEMAKKNGAKHAHPFVADRGRTTKCIVLFFCKLEKLFCMRRMK